MLTPIRRAPAAVLLLAILLPAASGQPPRPPAALTAMIEAERAFARRASEVGVRDSFLEYFADDAVRFDDAPAAAKAFLRQLEPQPPSVVELTWEPRLGDIAASGDLGYLTGPATRIVHADRPQGPAHLCYFSIWKKQSDGTFKVFIDQGISTPQPVSFGPGFTRAPAADRFTGDGSGGRETLMAADAALMAAAATTPPASVYRSFLAVEGRIYRDDAMPLAGPLALRWLEQARAQRMTGEPLHAEAAAAGDLGFTYGRYSLTGADGAERGHYVRVWSRDRSGRWRVALDVNAKTRS